MSAASGTTGDSTSPRTRIIEVAAALLAERGTAAVTTRAVADLAGVQAPAIYRLFGDKDGLVDAVVEHVMTTFTAEKQASHAAADSMDPVDALRTGWDMTIQFGLANPDLYVLICDPARSSRSPATQAGGQVLTERIHRVARAGRLRVSEQQALDLIRAAGVGAVMTTLAKPPPERNSEVADAMFDAVLRQILTFDDGPTPAAPSDVIAHAVALRAHAADLSQLRLAERGLLVDWLDRIISTRQDAREITRRPEVGHPDPS